MKKILLTLITVISFYQIVSGQTDTTTLVRTGQMAPVFSCKTIDGKVVDISKLQGKVILINFFATWCGPCNLELPVLEKNVWSKYRNNPDFVLLILGREHTEKEVSDFVTAKKFSMPFAPDPGRQIFKLYATQNIPRNVLIGRDGKIVYQSMGYSKEEFQKMEAMLTKQVDTR
jgi:peroxiredoxin